MNSPIFSIVIPTYNRSILIENAIQSILNQSFVDFEVIIIDDGSTDNTKEIISKISDHRLKYFYQQNKERGAARNHGVRVSTGKYITFLDSDDLLYSNCLSTVFSYITNNQNNFVSCGFELRDSRNKIIKPSLKLKGDLNKKLQFGNFLSCIGVFCERSLLINNPFSEERKLSGSEDWLLWLQLCSKYKLRRINTPLACMVEHDTRSVYQFSEEELIYRRDILINELKNNLSFNSFYGIRGLKNVANHMNTYIAIHLSLSKVKRKTILKYFIKGVKNSPKELFTRRTLAIFKHLI